MTRLILRRALAADPWKFPEDPAALPPDGDWIVPLAGLDAALAAQPARRGRLGVVLDPQDDPQAVAGALDTLALVAVRFPSFTDGRGYSIARLLRERLGWRGELRAVGDVQRDQLYLLERCGFDAFALREDQDPQQALAAFGDFSEAYQAAADRGALFERRFAIR